MNRYDFDESMDALNYSHLVDCDDPDHEGDCQVNECAA